MLNNGIIAINSFIIIVITLLIISKLGYADNVNYTFRNPIINSVDSVFINRIIIAGNKITEPDVILRELQSKERSFVKLSVLKEDVQRLYNLGLFSRIELLPVSEGNNIVNLIITVAESFYFLPVPQGGFVGGEFKKFWAGIDLRWNNFRGWNQTLGVSFALGFQPFISVYFFDPWVGKKEHFFAGGSVKYAKNVNQNTGTGDTVAFIDIEQLQDYKLFNFSTNFLIGKYLNPNFRVYTNAGYNILSVSEYKAGRTVSLDGTDRYLTIGLGLTYDSRNDIFYTEKGTYLNTEYKKIGFADDILSLIHI